MSAIDGLPPLREVIAAHGLSAKKQLGQNFLLDLNLTAKIARRPAISAACDVLEVGPGPGGLTRGLLAEGARRVLAVEKDARCLPALAEIAAAYPGRLEVVNGDALELDARGASDAADPGRGEPALQRRHRASGALADPADLAAVLAEPDADVPDARWPSGSWRSRAARPMAGWRCWRSGGPSARIVDDPAARGLHPAAQGLARRWSI